MNNELIARLSAVVQSLNTVQVNGLNNLRNLYGSICIIQEVIETMSKNEYATKEQ